MEEEQCPNKLLKITRIWSLLLFFSPAGFCDQLCMVGVPAGETGDFFRGNLWGDFGRGGRRPGLQGAAIRARGAGPGHSTGRTGALRTGATCGSTGEVRRADYRTNRVAAVCERRGIAGTGEKSSR